MTNPTRVTAILITIAGFALAVWAVYAFTHPEIHIEWSTATEFETAGYHLYRSSREEGPYERITERLIPASNDPISGGKYQFVDVDVEPGTTYYYQLEEVELNGGTNRESPVMATVKRRGIWEGLAGLLLLGMSAFLLMQERPR